MLQITAASPVLDPPPRRVLMRASRPSLVDLRFNGDPWVMAEGSLAAVRLGDYLLVQVAACPLDLPSLASTLMQVRSGQARRNYFRRIRRLNDE
jgi:hypothetical protein